MTGIELGSEDDEDHEDEEDEEEDENGMDVASIE
jgi:hypothetical protein